MYKQSEWNRDGAELKARIATGWDRLATPPAEIVVLALERTQEPYSSDISAYIAGKSFRDVNCEGEIVLDSWLSRLGDSEAAYYLASPMLSFTESAFDPTNGVTLEFPQISLVDFLADKGERLIVEGHVTYEQQKALDQFLLMVVRYCDLTIFLPEVEPKLHALKRVTGI